MSDTYLGAYWDSHSIHFVEIENESPQKMISVDFSEDESNIASLANDSESSIKFATNIQKAFSAKSVLSNHVNLALPTKDIIFRSFNIPWMPSHEIKGVVDFESSKYIPFSLEELFFAYHPITINKDGNKKIQIIFVAIKKDALQNYLEIINQAGLNVDIV